MGLSFTIAAGPRQRRHSQVRVLRDSWPHFTVSVSRLPQPGGSGPRIYIPQEQGGPVIPPVTGFPFRRILRHAGLRWRYSNPPPRWISLNSRASCLQDNSSVRTTEKTQPLYCWGGVFTASVHSKNCSAYHIENTALQCLPAFVSAGTCLPSRCSETCCIIPLFYVAGVT
jgi:hypothetical protein